MTAARRRRARLEQRPTFVLRLQAKPGTDGVRNLRLLLKSALRRFHLRCLDAREVGRAATENEILDREVSGRVARDSALRKLSSGFPDRVVMIPPSRKATRAPSTKTTATARSSLFAAKERMK
jgi:hypothetical protein